MERGCCLWTADSLGQPRPSRPMAIRFSTFRLTPPPGRHLARLLASPAHHPPRPAPPAADFFGATDSEDEYGATESCMRLLIHSRHMHSASATASCASPVASECASVSRRADSQSAANSAAPSSRAASGSLLSQHHRQAAGYATAYRELRERGAMRSEGSGGVKPVSANGPVRTVTVAGIPFGLREEFLARPAVATMTLQEIQAEKHELKVRVGSQRNDGRDARLGWDPSGGGEGQRGERSGWMGRVGRW